MNRRFKNFFLLVGLVVAGVFLCNIFSLFAAESGQINVQMTVPGAEEEPGGPGPAEDMVSPIISNVGTSVGHTTGSVYWVATDNIGVNSCYFDWGLSALYGQMAIWHASGTNGYAVDLSGLATGTIYYYKITCQDSRGNSAVTSSVFSTLSDFFYHKLLIKAKPEKRIFKTGGNLALNAILRLYHPVTKQKVYERAVVLDSLGAATIEDPAIPTGIFDAMLKGESHLAKRILSVDINNSGDVTLDFTLNNVFSLFAGDVQGTGLRDNFVDILDVSAEDMKFNSTEPVFDLNRDGVADVLDMSMILVNYNKSGDQI